MFVSVNILIETVSTKPLVLCERWFLQFLFSKVRKIRKFLNKSNNKTKRKKISQSKQKQNKTIPAIAHISTAHEFQFIPLSI
mmetsp:Transcript_16700/g.26500  ORF Transcript_16700/g.26500 Transcript_16700/m.26500 type:complete len:82 (-) Transcript_16700:368-613(-)